MRARARAHHYLICYNNNFFWLVCKNCCCRFWKCWHAFIKMCVCEWAMRSKRKQMCFEVSVLFVDVIFVVVVMSLPQIDTYIRVFLEEGNKNCSIYDFFFSSLLLFFYTSIRIRRYYVIYEKVSRKMHINSNTHTLTEREKKRPDTENANIGRECVYDAISQLKFC